jgi:glycosyltransferase involved in cell wall biosynthesis
MNSDIIERQEPIRVLAIVSKLMRGGLETRLMEIIRDIDKSKVVIDVFTYSLERGIFDDEVQKYGGRIFYNKPLTVFNMFFYIFYFKNFLLRHEEYLIIHAHQDAWCSVFCIGAKLAGIPIRIAHSRTSALKISLKNLVRSIIKYPTRFVATHFFAVSDKAAIWLFGKKRFKNGKVEIWPNAIEVQKYRFSNSDRQNMRSALNISEEFVVIHIGNFTPPKNHLFLLKIFKEIKSLNPESILLLVGGGNDGMIRAIIEKYELGNSVRLLGVRSDVNMILQAGDTFVFPSLYEGLPGSVLEAQAAGLSCFISDTITENVIIIDDLVSMISLEKEPKYWASYILGNYVLERADTTKMFIEKCFDVRCMVDRLERFYINAIDNIKHKQ